MRGRWTLAGSRPFPLSEGITCQFYRWDAPAEFDGFEVAFYCPDGELPRRFLCGAALEYWRDSENGAGQVDRICQIGLRVLSRLEGDLYAVENQTKPNLPAPPPIEAYEFYHALFRNRLLGHVSLKRHLRCKKDLIDLRKQGPEKWLIPTGLPETRDERLTGKEAIARLQEHFFAEAREELIIAEPCLLPIDRMRARGSVLEYFLVDGLYRKPGSITPDKSWGAAARSLIAGMDWVADEAVATAHIEEYRHFYKRLIVSFGDNAPEAFDNWLKTESEKGFHRLLPDGHKLRGSDREEAKRMARSFYRLLLWAAYQEMARAYGALLLVITVDFCNDRDINPTPVEQQLFNCMNRPQVFLGGLPLAFFTSAQLGWILGPLLDLWGLECFESENYDALTRLLGLYGQTALERREVDRAVTDDKKSEAKRREAERSKVRDAPTEEGDAVINVEEDFTDTHPAHFDPPVELDDPMEFPEITPPYDCCPKCRRNSLQLRGPSKRIGERWMQVELQCDHCDEYPWYARIDLTRLTSHP